MHYLPAVPVPLSVLMRVAVLTADTVEARACHTFHIQLLLVFILELSSGVAQKVDQQQNGCSYK